METIANKKVKDILSWGENLLPYDENSTLSEFRKAIANYPDFQEHLEEQLNSNTSWVQKAENEQIYFIISDNRWKRMVNYKPQLKLTLIGPNAVPVISISL